MRRCGGGARGRRRSPPRPYRPMKTGPLAHVEVARPRLRIKAVLVCDAVDDPPRQQAIERRLRVEGTAEERLEAARVAFPNERLGPPRRAEHRRIHARRRSETPPRHAPDELEL